MNRKNSKKKVLDLVKVFEPYICINPWGFYVGLEPLVFVCKKHKINLRFEPLYTLEVSYVGLEPLVNPWGFYVGLEPLVLVVKTKKESVKSNQSWTL